MCTSPASGHVSQPGNGAAPSAAKGAPVQWPKWVQGTHMFLAALAPHCTQRCSGRISGVGAGGAAAAAGAPVADAAGAAGAAAGPPAGAGGGGATADPGEAGLPPPMPGGR